MVDVLLLVATTMTMLAMNWRISLISLVVVPVAGLLVWAINKPMKRHQRTALEKVAEVESVVIETVQAIQTIKGLSCGKQLLRPNGIALCRNAGGRFSLSNDCDTLHRCH